MSALKRQASMGYVIAKNSLNFNERLKIDLL